MDIATSGKETNKFIGQCFSSYIINVRWMQLDSLEISHLSKNTIAINNQLRCDRFRGYLVCQSETHHLEYIIQN